MIHVTNIETKGHGYVFSYDSKTLSVRFIKRDKIEHREVERSECFGDVKCSIWSRIFTLKPAIYEVITMDGSCV